ncbi:hypothetical protein LAZ67_1004911, partial [Cordylochernes scorpioides]
MATNVVWAESPSKAEEKPVRLGSKAQPSAEITAKNVLQINSSMNSKENQNYVNPSAGSQDANSAAPVDLAAIPTSNAASQVRRNWADITEEVNPGAEEGFTLVQGRKRRRGSGNSPTTAAPSSNAGASRTIRRPQSSAGSVPRAQEIRATRAHIADARARQASSSEEHCVYIEHSPELEPFHYLRALDRKLGGTAGVIQITKVNGHQLLGLTNRGLAERLISEGLEVEGTLLRAFPLRKRAERITVGNLPFFVADSAVITALSPFGRVTSIAPKQMKAGPYVYVDGRRDVFITLHEGITIERLPTRLDINIKGQAWPAYLSSGIRCSRCHGQGHRRAICPLLAGLANNTRMAPPTTPAGVPPPTTSAPPQRAPPMARAVLHPSAPRPSPPAAPALPMEETPSAPPPVIPAPSLQAPEGSVGPRSANSQHPEPPPARPDFVAPRDPLPAQKTLGPAAPTPDVEMSIVEETSASSTSLAKNATRVDLDAFIERHPSVSFAGTDALGLGREEVLDLLSSRTKAQRKGPLLSPLQCDALAGLIGQILDLRPGAASNLYKVLGQVKAELRTTPAVPPTPTLPAPRPAKPTPRALHGEKTSPDIATPPPPLIIRKSRFAERNSNCFEKKSKLCKSLRRQPGCKFCRAGRPLAAILTSNAAAQVRRNWADITEEVNPGAEEGFTLVQGRKRRRGSANSPTAAAASSNPGGSRTIRRPQSSAGSVPRAQEIRATRAHIADARARGRRPLPRNTVCTSNTAPNLSPSTTLGLWIGNSEEPPESSRSPRAERITVGNLPFFIGDSEVINALSPYGRVTSIAPKQTKAGPYVYVDGRRDVFITLHEGSAIERLPTRLDINIKGEAWPAYLSSGIRCSRCHGQGHRRAICPLLAGQANNTRMAPPTTPAGVPPPTTPAPPQRSAAQPPAPAPSNPAMEVCSAPPVARAVLHPSAPRPSPPAAPTLPMEETPSAPPPVTPAPSLQVPEGPVGPRSAISQNPEPPPARPDFVASRDPLPAQKTLGPAAPTPDVEMSIVEETFASSTSSAKNATRVDLDAFIEKHPSVATPLASLIGQILNLRPGAASNLYKVLGQVKAELRPTPSAVPTPPLPAPRPSEPVPLTSHGKQLSPALRTPPLPAPAEMEEDVPMTEEERCAPPPPAPRLAGPIPPVPHGDSTTPAMATPPPPLSTQMDRALMDKRWEALRDLMHELDREFELDLEHRFQSRVDVDDIITAILYPGDREPLIKRLPTRDRYTLGGLMSTAIRRARELDPSILQSEEKPVRLGTKAQPNAEIPAKNALQFNSSMKSTKNQRYVNPATGGKDANPAAPTDFAASSSSEAAAQAHINWADLTEDSNSEYEGNFTVVQKRKRRRGSANSSPAAAPSSNLGGARTNRRPQSSAGWAPRAQEVRTTRAHIVEARARQASSTEDHCVYIERSPELEPYHYMRALDRMLGGTREVFQMTKMNGHFLVGLANRGLAERLVNEGLEVEGTLHRAFPFRKRAERITVGNLPFFVGDAAVISALSTFGRVTSIAPKLMKAGPYVYNDGRREAFIILREGMTIERLPTRLDISIKGEAWLAYLSSGIRCSRCRGQGHRRANCPMLAGRTTAPGPATPTSPSSVPPATAPRLPQQPSAQPPPPASPSSTMEVSDVPPASRAAPLPPAALQPSPPAPSALHVEDAPPAPPPVTTAPSLRTPGSCEPAAQTPDVEMSIAEETSASSTSSAKNATRVDLDAFIEKHPSVSFAGTDALGLGREEVLDLLSSRTKAQRKGPLLSPLQCDALAGLIGQILDLRPGAASNLYKVLGQVKAELRTTPAVPPTPTLPAPRPAKPTPRALHGEKTSPDIATPPPPLIIRKSRFAERNSNCFEKKSKLCKSLRRQPGCKFCRAGRPLAAILTSNAAAQVRRNWADITEEVNPGAEEGFTLVQGRKRRRGSANSPTAAAASSNPGGSRTIRRPQSSAGSVPRAQEIRATRAHIADARARGRRPLPRNTVCTSNTAPNLSPSTTLGLWIGNSEEPPESSRSPRAERITVGNLPFFIGDSEVINALSPYGRVTSIAPKQTKAGPYVYVDGRRDVFITLHEGSAIERLPTRLDINIKGEAWPAYLSSGIRCSRCHGQGHRRAICPLLAGQANNTRMAPPTTPAGVPPPTTPAPPQRSAAQPPAPAPSNPAMEVCSAPPVARAVLHPSAPRPSPPAAPTLPMEETPSAPPPVTPAPSLQVPEGPVGPRSAISQNPEPPPARPDFVASRDPLPAQKTLGPAAPTPDVEMSIVEETFASSTSSAKNATRVDLDAFIEKHPSVSFAGTDALGLGREEVLDLLSSRTKAQRKGPLLSPPQCDALASLIGQILNLRPGAASNLYKVLGQVKAELRPTPSAVPTPPLPAPRPSEPVPLTSHGKQLSPALRTPPLPAPAEMEEDVPMTEEERCAPPPPAPRLAGPIPPVPHGDSTTPAMATPPPPLSTQMDRALMDKRWEALRDLMHELDREFELDLEHRFQSRVDVDDIITAILYPGDREPLIKRLPTRDRYTLGGLMSTAIRRARELDPSILQSEEKPVRLGTKAQPNAEIPAKNALQFNSSMKSTKNQRYVNPATGGKDANPAAPTDFAASSSSEAAAQAHINWADLTEDSNSEYEGNFTVVQKRKRRRGSANSSPAAAPSSNLGGARTNRRPQSSAGWAPRAQEVRTTRAHIVEARARQASSTEDHCVYIERSPELEPYHYMRALDRMLGGTREVFQMTKMNGHFLVGLANRGLAERLVNEGLEVEGTLHRAFPFRKRAERITVGNLPFFVGDAAVISALSTFGRVTSIAPKLMKAGPYVYNDGRREAFIILREGMTIERLPTRLDISIKGEAWLAYLSSGIRCSRCRGQGHRRANCPMLAGRTTAPGPATPTSPSSVPPATAPRLPQQPSAQPPPPASPSSTMEVSDVPPASRAAPLPPAALQPSPPAPSALHVEDAPPAPPPVTTAPSLRTPGSCEPAAQTPDVEMSIAEETSASSTSSAKNATRVDLDAFIEKHPSVSFAGTDALGLGREEVLDLLSSRTKAQRKGPLLSPLQCDALAGLIGQTLDLRPGAASNLYKVLGQVKAELRTTPAVPPTPPLPAPRPAGPTSPALHGERTSPDIATPPPPLSTEFIDACYDQASDIIYELSRERYSEPLSDIGVTEGTELWKTPDTGKELWITPDTGTERWTTLDTGTELWTTLDTGTEVWTTLDTGTELWTTSDTGTELWTTSDTGTEVWTTLDTGTEVWTTSDTGTELWTTPDTGTELDRAVNNSRHRDRAVDNSRHRDRAVDNSRHRDRAVDNSRHRDRGVDNSRHRDRAVDNFRHRDRAVDNSRHRDRAVDNSRHRDRAVDNYRHRERAVDNSRHRDRGVDNSRHRDRAVDNFRHRDRAVENSRHRDRAVDNSRHRDRAMDNSRHRDIAMDNSRHRDRGTELWTTPDTGTELWTTPDTGTEPWTTHLNNYRHRDRAVDNSRHRDRAVDNSRHRDRAVDNSPEQLPTQGQSCGQLPTQGQSCGQLPTQGQSCGQLPTQGQSRGQLTRTTTDTGTELWTTSDTGTELWTTPDTGTELWTTPDAGTELWTNPDTGTDPWTTHLNNYRHRDRAVDNFRHRDRAVDNSRHRDRAVDNSRRRDRAVDNSRHRDRALDNSPEQLPTQGQSCGQLPTQGQSCGQLPTQGQSCGQLPTQGQSCGQLPAQGQSCGQLPTQGQSCGQLPTQGQSRGQLTRTTTDTGTELWTTTDTGTEQWKTPGTGTELRTTPDTGTELWTTPDTGTEVWTTPDTGTELWTTPDPGTEVWTTPDTGTELWTTPDPGTEVWTTPDTGTELWTTPDTGTELWTTPDPGTEVWTTPDTGTELWTTPDPGKEVWTTPDTGTELWTTPDPGTEVWTTPDTGTEPWTTHLNNYRHRDRAVDNSRHRDRAVDNSRHRDRAVDNSPEQLPTQGQSCGQLPTQGQRCGQLPTQGQSCGQLPTQGQSWDRHR